MKMTDLIDRQAAIDMANDMYQGLSIVQASYSDIGRALVKFLNLVPSAQPEIIRCKDCKYWMPHSQLGFDEDNEAYHDYCEKLIPEDEYYAFYRDADDYCSRAERRTDE